jgi:hypothetical protein
MKTCRFICFPRFPEAEDEKTPFHLQTRDDLLIFYSHRPRVDDKTASEYQLEGGATLHLVLALRGGQ